MPKLWNKDQEKHFFLSFLKTLSPEHLFYFTKDKRYLAYWIKNYDGIKSTLQSRNSLIGSYTEKWTADLFTEIASEIDAFAVPNVICEELGLTNTSPADIAICKSKGNIQPQENILLIVEVKMSVVWNWEFIPSTNQLICIGDHRTHQGNPGLLRSDSMLKAIGKSINIRVSSFAASSIPIIVLGNTPVTKNYFQKVDHLKRNGIIQGFWSINPSSSDQDETLKSTPSQGFYRFDNYKELKENTLNLLKEKNIFFSGMRPQKKLGEFIEIANQKTSYKAKAEKFLSLLRNE